MYIIHMLLYQKLHRTQGSIIDAHFLCTLKAQICLFFFMCLFCGDIFTNINDHIVVNVDICFDIFSLDTLNDTMKTVMWFANRCNRTRALNDTCNNYSY